MLKKLFRIMLSFVLIVTTVGMSTAAAAIPDDMQGKLADVERAAYGGVQTGPIIERINRLEKDFTGTHPSGSIMERTDVLYDMMFNNDRGPSVLTQLNAVEWSISKKVSMEPVQKRVGDLETQIAGKQTEATYLARIDKLAGYAYGSKPIPLTQIALPMNALVKISTVTPINAKNLKAGDLIEFQAAEDIMDNGMLLFAKGAPGLGVVQKVSQAGNFGRDAKVVIDFKQLKAIDGTEVDMVLGKESQKMMESMAMAAGASIAGMAILGPIGIIGGAFVKGKNINFPAGTELLIQTKADTSLYGLETGTDITNITIAEPEQKDSTEESTTDTEEK